MASDVKVDLSPGSDAALACGCRCPVLDNCHGKGYYMQPGVFVISDNCTLHAPELPPPTADVQTERKEGE